MSKILTNPNSLVTVDALNYYADNNVQSLNPNDPVTVEMLAEFFELNSSNLTNPNSIVTVDTLNYYNEQKPTPGPSIKSFSTATDEEITAMLNAVRTGDISYDDLVAAGWTVGAERPVHLSAMAATGVGESHVAQNQTWVILHGKDFFNLADGGKNLFVVGIKNLLANGTSVEKGYMNSSWTNSGGWNSCNRRTWCNNVFKNAIPSEELNWFKRFKVKASNGSKSTAVTESTDLFSLPSRAEVFGGSNTTYTPDAEGTTILSYYSTEANRIRHQGDLGMATTYWLRSPYVANNTDFARVMQSGTLSANKANGNISLAPFGCF